jgi:homoserine dehydrogenase
MAAGSGSIRTIPLAILGLGGVGRALLHQLLDTRAVLADRLGLALRPVVLADSRAALVDPTGIAAERLAAALQAKEAGAGLDALPGAFALAELDIPPRAIVLDLTASPATAPLLPVALERHGGVVLANKLALTAPYAQARRLLEHPRVRYEATVGAGLPVIAALRILLNSGDRLLQVEGALSGTLGYLAARLDQGVPYSAAVAQARELGYSEPDPREDLGGRDVARKALILARTAGWPLEMEDVQVESLYPPDLASLPVDAFLAAAAGLDADFATRVAAAGARGEVLRYLARVGPAGAAVGLAAVPRAGGLGALRGTANHITITTERYRDSPLVIAGPGAGVEVTAAGVLADVVDLARSDWREEAL